MNSNNSNDDEAESKQQQVPSKRQRLAAVDDSDDNDTNNEGYQQQQQQEENTSTMLTMFGGGTTNNDSIVVVPTMRLMGHKKSVYSLAYDPNGECLCSSSFDMTCLLWSVTTFSFHNYNVLKGHKNAVLDVKFSGEEHIVTASADKTLIWWDACTGERIRTFRGHTKVVNAVSTSQQQHMLLASASDDGYVKLWDARVGSSKGAFVMQLLHNDTNHCQVTSVALNDTSVYTGGIDNFITEFDVRVSTTLLDDFNKDDHRKVMSMKGHTDTITCLSVSPDGTQLLSNSMDATLRSWDIRPFVAPGTTRHLKTFRGGTHNAEKGLLNCSWSADSTMISAGSADRLVHVWDEYTAEELYCLPGHTGCVNSVLFHPHQNNLIASASSDKTIFIGQLAQ